MDRTCPQGNQILLGAAAVFVEGSDFLPGARTSPSAEPATYAELQVDLFGTQSHEVGSASDVIDSSHRRSSAAVCVEDANFLPGARTSPSAEPATYAEREVTHPERKATTLGLQVTSSIQPIDVHLLQSVSKTQTSSGSADVPVR